MTLTPSLRLLPVLICVSSTMACSQVIAATNKNQADWSGFYAGMSVGANFSQYDVKSNAHTSASFNAAQVSAINNAGDFNIDDNGFLAGIQAGYNWQFNHLLVGLDSDLETLSVNAEKNSGAVVFPGLADRQFVITAYGRNNWLLTLRPRLGLVADDWMFYLTGGLALTYLQGDFIYSREVTNTGAVGMLASNSINTVKPGYVLGTGLETAVTKNLSLRVEYQYQHFGSTKAENKSNLNTELGDFDSSVKFASNIVKVGLNYFFNAPSGKFTDPLLNSNIFNVRHWMFEVGSRLFIGSGLDGAPQPLLNTGPRGNTLASRLTFTGLTSVAGETFADIEHSTGLFLKGYMGAGSIASGQLNDEDFPAGGAYSNTLSDSSGNLSYATADLGYDFLKSTTGHMGAFVGYNYYAQNIYAYSCTQLAGASVCVPSSELNNFPGISENDYFNSLRLGLSTQFHLSSRLSLVSEVAYVPHVHFTGEDTHNARELVGPEASKDGDGAMLEAILEYQLTHSWRIGIGGRYWMWNMRNGTVQFDFIGQGGSVITVPGRFTTQRYGGFVQLSYFYQQELNDNLLAAPINWQGFSVGINLGGARADSHWSDPFNATDAGAGRTNFAAFGNNIQLTGPLGGATLGMNWQTHQFVYGINTLFDAADIRGENTAYSGLGGVNATMITNYVLTMTAKLGLAASQAMYYVDGGAAMVNTQYQLNGDTSALILGKDHETLNRWGWAVGAGIDCALAAHWIANIEYDYIGIPNHTIAFPAVTTINQQRLTADQALNLFRLGLSYKFG